MNESFERLIREAARREKPPDVWWAVELLIRARRLRGEEQLLAILSVANCLVRHGRLLDMASDLLGDLSRRSTPRHLVLTAQAALAERRGDLSKAKALRRLAGVAPDAPTDAESLTSEWTSLEVSWRKVDPSKAGKRARLDAFFQAQRTLRMKARK